MSAPSPTLRIIGDDPRAAAVPASGPAPMAARMTVRRGARTAYSLTFAECALGLGALVLWLMLFAAGILVDTEPYRMLISPSGVQALKVESGVPNAGTTPALPSTTPGTQGLIVAWAMVFTCFLPLNLAWLCVAASTLGAVGNLANLNDDQTPSRHADTSSPYMSAVLRGFFVYLFLMSGLLLLEHAPFSNAGPSQYIRLAGFLSLFSFAISYSPQLFSALIQSAFTRLNGRAGADTSGGADAELIQANVNLNKGTLDVAMVRDNPESSRDAAETRERLE